MNSSLKEEAGPALLTRSEIDWLLGKKEVTKTYEYYLRSTVRKKLKTFNELEFPLLVKKGFIETQSPDLSPSSKELSAGAKVEDTVDSLIVLNEKLQERPGRDYRSEFRRISNPGRRSDSPPYWTGMYDLTSS